VWNGPDTSAFAAIVAAVSAWLFWIARPDFLPLGHGPDLTHHLMLVDFVERHWRLPHDPAVEPYLGEFFHYTPGAHLLTSLAGAWVRLGGLRAAHPVLALALAIKAGFVYLVARRVVRRLPLALAAVVLSFAPAAYVLGSFMHDFFFAQVTAELFAIAFWWAATIWDDGARREGAFFATVAGVATFLTWPIWIGPLLLMFAIVTLSTGSLPLRERAGALAIVAVPTLAVFAIYSAGRIGWLSIVRTTGGVTWPTVAATGWIFPLLAVGGLAVAVRWRRARTTIVMVAAIAAQAAVLFALASRAPTDTPYMALKMMYLAVYPLAVCASVALAALSRERASIAWLLASILAVVIGRDVIRTPRERPVVSMPLYRAGGWARAHLPPACVEYLVGNADTAYWLHLAVLGNPRMSARTADLDTFDERLALLRWIGPGDLPYAIADLTVVPRDVLGASDVVARFDTAAVLQRRGAGQRCN
jgi:hypothetical protein